MIKQINYPFFSVQNNDSISSLDLKNLRKFYAPILGSNAILLYEYFRDLSLSNDEVGYYDFDSLTYLLNMSIKELNDARIKLESVSLIATYIDEYNRKTLFVMERPLDKNGFKKNLILANKLIKIIGKQNFENLLGKERNLFLLKAKYLLNASAKYDEVFYDDDYNEELSLLFGSSHEIDSTTVDTQEINTEIQEKLDLNDFQYPNPYEAVLKTDSRFFFSQISGQIPNEQIIELIKEAREAKMSDPCLNLIFFYAYEVNRKINYNYVKKIVCELIKKDIFSFRAIEKYLDDLIKVKSNIVVSRKDLYKATYLEGLQKAEAEYENSNID